MHLSAWPSLAQAAAALHWTEAVAVLTGVAYVILAARGDIRAWYWGIVSCALWAYATFVLYQLWLDAILQLFYVALGFAGLWQWKYGGRGRRELPVSRMSWRAHLAVLSGGSILSLAFGYFFDAYTPAAATYLDAFTTVFAIINTFALVRKIVENWLYWIAIDAVYVYLYATQGAWLFALLMTLNVVIAALGYLRWRRLWLAALAEE